ncbi:glycosyltransferase family 4 protein [Gramella sp. AN32]|uniref:Glycosyltransferase family 4 protein n=1 Tax=Christiangramia antarctica TaxID=2058158 RepID=A0ABW5X5P2_9FLAO|nr:glycosyltransferase [Gramella sp. AN32]
MKILQLIDSLRPGGAERMALNYFLALEREGHHSLLVASREEGLLAEQVDKKANYHFLRKLNAFDFRAFYKLKKIISENNIEIIQAHSSSWFWAVLCKITGSKIKIIWHDHYGNSEYPDNRKSRLLRKFSKYFDGIISVNEKLMKWSREKLEFNKPIIYLPNFVNEKSRNKKGLQGNSAIKIICVANLRPQKDHYTLIEAFREIQDKYNVTLHLFGRDFNDQYSGELLNMIENNSAIFYYGEVNPVVDYLGDADIGILSSKSEGLPLALLEYGMVGLPVICTAVGECERVVGGDGKVVPPNNPVKLSEAIKDYLDNPEEAKLDSLNFHTRIEKDYSEKAVLKKFSIFIQNLKFE